MPTRGRREINGDMTEQVVRRTLEPGTGALGCTKPAWSIRSVSSSHSRGCVRAGKIALPYHVEDTAIQ